jgi:hypothetical protein
VCVHEIGQRFVAEVVQRFLNRFGHALNINAPPGQLGSQPRILAFAANRQR